MSIPHDPAADGAQVETLKPFSAALEADRRTAPSDVALLVQAGILEPSDSPSRHRLTPKGRAMVEVASDQEAAHSPRYEADTRTLQWRGIVLRRWARSAPCQVAILTAFEEAGWPERIDDPLPCAAGLDPKERMRETIKSLNRGLPPKTIRFRADGTGEGVRWLHDQEEKSPSPLHLPWTGPGGEG